MWNHQMEGKEKLAKNRLMEPPLRLMELGGHFLSLCSPSSQEGQATPSFKALPSPLTLRSQGAAWSAGCLCLQGRSPGMAMSCGQEQGNQKVQRSIKVIIKHLSFFK